MPVRKNRVTRWTDDRGNVLEEHKGPLAVNALMKARNAGIPARLLHRAGWNGDEDDIAGYFTDMIYRLLSLPLIGPVDMSDANEIVSQMVSVCGSCNVDYREAIDFEYPRFLRDWREHRARLMADDWQARLAYGKASTDLIEGW